MRTPAFTLVELLITTSIIAILTGIATVSYSGIRARARDAQRDTDLRTITVALASFYSGQAVAQYPASTGDAVPQKVAVNGTTDALSVALLSYTKTVPVDPVNSGSTVYRYQSFKNAAGTQADYKLFATLENKLNKKGWAGGSAWVADGFVLENQ